MRNKYRRSISLLLLLALLLNLCGCSRGEEADSTEATEESTAPVIASELPLGTDPVIAAHRENNEIAGPQQNGREAYSFQLYIANNETMECFVNTSRVMPYQSGLHSVFDAAFAQYESLTAYSLDASGTSWVEEAVMDSALLRKVQLPSFYAGKPLSDAGPLHTLFQQEEPFQKNALTVIVSNFVEPSFDLSAMSVAIGNYFDTYDHSSACIIGMRSEVTGQMHIPSVSEDRNTFYITDLGGVNQAVEAPFYIVVVGPSGAVENYTSELRRNLEAREVTFAHSSYNNSLYEEEIAPVLTFDIVKDPKAKKAYASTMASYNTGELQISDNGDFCVTTYDEAETVDARDPRKNDADRDLDSEEGEEEKQAISVRRSTQVALISNNYDSNYDYTVDWKLYEYVEGSVDASAGATWKEVGKTGSSQVSFEMYPVYGGSTGLVDQINDDLTAMILAPGGEEYYLVARLDFSDKTLLSRNSIYRLELQIGLNQTTTRMMGNRSSTLEEFSVAGTDYYDAIQQFSALLRGNRSWSSKPHLQASTAMILAKTPNLDVLLNQLENLQDSYQENDSVVQYIDILYNLSNG